jgi:flavin reductase (DIM6/NTAB) family NADH-FMN oxidoreductase RutF
MQVLLPPSNCNEAHDYVVADLKGPMRELAAGVVIITAVHNRLGSGLNATVACSLTADPPSLLICINQSSHTHDYILERGRFCMNVLAQQHRKVAQVLAGTTKLTGEAKFAYGKWEGDTERPPRLADALVSTEREVFQTVEVGTHTIFIGRVLTVAGAPEH